MNIVLIGGRGSGKTTLAYALQKKLMWPLIETDKMIEEKTGMKVSKMVKKYGWNYFREKESSVIKNITLSENAIIATGGGVILNPENMTRLKNNAVTVWLKASTDALYKRTKIDANRPFLTEALDRKKDIEKTMAQRRSLYQKYADLVINTEDKTVEQSVFEIMHYFRL